MASTEQVDLNEPHAPRENAIEAFNAVLPQIKNEIIKSRKDWDKHEPRMWSRAAELSDDELTKFTIENDLISVRSIVSQVLRVTSIHPYCTIQSSGAYASDVSDLRCCVTAIVPFFYNYAMTPEHTNRSGVVQRPMGTSSLGRSESLQSMTLRAKALSTSGMTLLFAAPSVILDF
ncbi:hypothetical protein D9756_007544 [Leucocoprinus leucothites]|uniref:Uncharacterized protein n=1 Tax=Leucocoprinus leucothites TaxID=201217 RepID=A0A8H5FWF1_9AGAR|nr:hypothetical protein D9756_007544 [Leucoagaricus leucothites]